MATYSQLLITFTNDWINGDILKIRTFLDNAPYQGGTWTWASSRSTGFEVTTGTPTANVGERAAIQFKTAFDLDYPSGYTTSVQNVNQVLIKSTEENEIFTSGFYGPSNTGRITSTVSNYNTTDESNLTALIEKYYIHYCDDFNTERDVYILQRGFIGSATELVGDVNPITITYESADDFKFSPIRPSTAEVFMIFDSESGPDFEELWTADEREFQVQDIRDGVVDWIGFVVPSGFEYDFVGGKYKASLTAIDGLSLLESIPFIDDNNKPYGNQDLVYNNNFSFPIILVMTEILAKLGLELDLWTCVDSYEQTMTKTGDVRAADPLANTYVNVKTYINDGENEDIPYWYQGGDVWNCKDVMENLLYIFGAKLYQENAKWRIKTINADVDFGSGATQRYWRKYNTVATYLSNYEVVDDEVIIPCSNNEKFLIGNSHKISMDDVYKSFRMNYEYKFLREGDDPLQLLPTFCGWTNDNILSAPTGWERWRWDSKWYIRIKDVTVDSNDADGNTCGIEIGTHKVGIPTTQGNVITDSNPAIWTALHSTNYSYVEKGSKIILDVWCKYKFQSNTGNVRYYPVFKCDLWSESKRYFLRNSIVNNKRNYTWQLSQVDLIDMAVVPDALSTTAFFYLDFFTALNSTTSDLKVYDWWHFQFEIQEPPEGGYIDFYIHGLSADSGRISINFPAFSVYRDWENLDNSWLKVVRENWIDEGGDIPRLQFADVSMSVIQNESELPQQQDYIYYNTNTNYSFQVDPITVYNGDVQNASHVSNLYVPTNTSGGKNFWDDLGNTYGYSSLGLLTVREIMRQYQKPYRILEGDVKLEDARFGSVYTFQVLPSLRWVLLRGSFNKQKGWIEDATFVQLTDDTLADGGNEGGTTLDADWQPTGVLFCHKVNYLNDGYVVEEQRDVNPNSETYNDLREVISASQDLTMCPLNIPEQYYWGSDDIYLNTNLLLFAPYTVIDGKEIQIAFNNTEGNYLYFVHLKSLGVVERITTPTSPNNVLADWVYVGDRSINGYLYRVLRTDYVMSEFTGFVHNFRFA